MFRTYTRPLMVTTASGESMYTVRGAARYLGLSMAGLRYHIYVTHAIDGDDWIHGKRVFRRETLDRFQQTRPPIGRPPTRKQGRHAK